MRKSVLIDKTLAMRGKNTPHTAVGTPVIWVPRGSGGLTFLILTPLSNTFNTICPTALEIEDVMIH